MVELFAKDVSVISRHIFRILKDGELEVDSNLQKMQIPNSDKPITVYSLYMIISVGYRVYSKQCVILGDGLLRSFEIYASGLFCESASRGFAGTAV